MHLIAAELVWEGDVLAVAHAPARGELRVRDFGGPFARADEVEARVIARDGRLLLASGESAATIALPLGRASVRLAVVPRHDAALPRARSDRRVAKGVLLGAVIHATILAIAILGRAPVGDEQAARTAVMAGYVAAIEARADEERATLPPTTDPDDGIGGDSKAAAAGAQPKEAAAAGSIARVAEGGIGRRTRGQDRHATRPSEESPETFGMLAILAGDRVGDRAGISAFADVEGPGAVGSIFGTRIEDAPGMAGVALSGIGEGGGGSGAGVPLALSGFGDGSAGGGQGLGLGSLGTIGHPGGTGTGQGIGKAQGRLAGSHQVKSPILRCGSYFPDANAEGASSGRPTGCFATVNGRLPPETIQRIVRQNFGRLRACYEAGLVRDPSLEGRIAVKFVIDREGAVSMASVEDRSFADATVASCVQRAYMGMSFPRPEGGIVTVVYPLVFSS